MKYISKRLIALLITMSLLFGSIPTVFAGSGIEYDEDGGVWDFDNGTYTAPDGTIVYIFDGDSNSGDNSGYVGTNQNPDGSVTINTGNPTETTPPSSEATILGYVTTIINGANLRLSIGGTVICQLDKGLTFPYTKEPEQDSGYTWYYIQAGENKGYVRGDSVSIADIPEPADQPNSILGYIKATINGIAFRRTAGFGVKIGEIDKDEILPFYETSVIDGIIWYKSKHETFGDGWIHGYYVFKCDVNGNAVDCGEGNHISDANYSSDEYDENYHWQICTRCGKAYNKSNHYADCSNPNTCKVCNAKNIKASWISHAYDYSQYVYNTKEHWVVCSNCGEKDISSHFSACDNTPDVCDTCGASGNILINLRHNIDWNSYTYDEKYHWHACSKCEYETSSKNKHQVTHDNPNLCTECGATNPVDPIIVHQFSETYGGNQYQHWRTCTVCGEIDEIDDHSGNCNTPNTCIVCGKANITTHYSDHQFDYSEPIIGKEDGHYRICCTCNKEVLEGSHIVFCNDPRKCAQCGLTNLLNVHVYHDRTEYQYNDNIHWAICSICGEVLNGYRDKHRASCKNPDICISCGAIGITLSSISHNSDYPSYSYDDTKHWNTCKDCGKILWYGGHTATCTDQTRCYICGAHISGSTVIEHAGSILDEITPECHIYRCKDCGEITYISYHMVSCANKESKCMECGMIVDEKYLDHGSASLTGRTETDSHIWQCDWCGHEYREPHKAYCDSPDTCYVCGVTGDEYSYTIEHSAYEQIGSELVCTRCNQPHEHIFPCYSNGVCSECGILISQVDDATIEHVGQDYSTYMITEHWHASFCRACGEAFNREEHSFVHGYCSICEKESSRIEDLYIWTENNGCATITGFYGKTDSLVIPNSLNSLPVTAIGSQAFMDNTKLKTVYIPATVTSIGNYAFRACTSLQSISLPENLTSIGNYAFYGTTALKEIYLPLSVESIANTSFKDSALEAVTCYSASYAHQWAAGKNYRLTLIPLYADAESLMLPGALHTIDEEAFNGISAKRIVVPNGCASIGKKAFAFCADLEVLELPGTVMEIDNTALYGSEGVMILAPKGSYAVEWANKNGIQVIGK